MLSSYLHLQIINMVHLCTVKLFLCFYVKRSPNISQSENLYSNSAGETKNGIFGISLKNTLCSWRVTTEYSENPESRQLNISWCSRSSHLRFRWIYHWMLYNFTVKWWAQARKTQTPASKYDNMERERETEIKQKHITRLVFVHIHVVFISFATFSNVFSFSMSSFTVSIAFFALFLCR